MDQKRYIKFKMFKIMSSMLLHKFMDTNVCELLRATMCREHGELGG